MRFVRAAAFLFCALALDAGALPVPRHSPEFAVQFPNGHQLLLSSLKGKVVAIEFLSTTCPHCQRASQVFSKLYAEYGSRGFQPVGVAFNPMANMYVDDFVKSNGATYPVGFSPREAVLDYLGVSEIDRLMVPQIVWIDRRGTIRSQTPAPDDNEKLLQESYWREMIETLTKEPDPTAKKPVRQTTARKRPAS